MTKKTNDSQLKAVHKYRKAKTKTMLFDFILDKESDIIEKLESVPNKKGYIVGLIRKDIGGE